MSDGPADAAATVVVEIAGQSYRLQANSAAGGGAGVEAVAAVVNERMAEILAAVPSLSTDRAAILTALNVADDLLACRARTRSATAEAVAAERARLEDAVEEAVTAERQRLADAKEEAVASERARLESAVSAAVREERGRVTRGVDEAVARVRARAGEIERAIGARAEPAEGG